MKTMQQDKTTDNLISLSLLIGFVAAIGALIFFAWLTSEVLEGDAQQFDEVTRLAVHKFASPSLTVIMRWTSFLGSTIFLSLGTIAVVIWFVVKRWRREAMLFAITMIGASLLNTTLKLAFKRPRPVPYFDLTAPETYSFPSGHSLASACFFGGLAALLAARIQRRRVKTELWGLAVMLFLLIGLSRIYLGVHYTTDVIAGFAAALIWIMCVRFVELHYSRRRSR